MWALAVHELAEAIRHRVHSPRRRSRRMPLPLGRLDGGPPACSPRGSLSAQGWPSQVAAKLSDI